MPSDRKQAHQAFSRLVKEAFDESKGRYGAVKICRSLNDSGISYSVKRVQRHMSRLSLRSVVVKKYNHHANNHRTFPEGKENILNRDFQAATVNEKWCTDITYIHVLKEGWTYLASVMDLCSRKGNPYDNACIESLHSVLKKEEIHLHTYQDSKEARRAIFEYIESWYNRKRIHSAIDYMTTQQKEDEELKKVA